MKIKKGKKQFTPPKPESYLTEDQIEIYHRICDHIYAHTLLQKIDSVFVSQVAFSLDQISQLSEIINENGPVQVFASGASNVSGHYSALNKERDFLIKATTELGLSVKAREKLLSFADRTKLDSDKAKFANDPFMALIGGDKKN